MRALVTENQSRPKDARDAVPRRLSKWHRSFLDGDILLKWTPYSQERLGPVLLFAQNSKVPVISFESTLVLYCFVSRAARRRGRHPRRRVESRRKRSPAASADGLGRGRGVDPQRGDSTRPVNPNHCERSERRAHRPRERPRPSESIRLEASKSGRTHHGVLSEGLCPIPHVRACGRNCPLTTADDG